MCIPIHPNEDHPTGRAPLHTIPEFPISNCYHWSQLGLDVRVRAKPEGEVFDATRAIHLPVPQRLDTLDCWEADQDRAEAILKSRRKKAVSGIVAPITTRLTVCAVPLSHQERAGGIGVSPTSGAHDFDASSCSSTSSEDSDLEDHESEYSLSDSLGGEDVFGILGRDVAGLDYPLVDFSYDLRATLSADNIPNPMDLPTEHTALQG